MQTEITVYKITLTPTSPYETDTKARIHCCDGKNHTEVTMVRDGDGFTPVQLSFSEGRVIGPCTSETCKSGECPGGSEIRNLMNEQSVGPPRT
jgi:hypothetical protein